MLDWNLLFAAVSAVATVGLVIIAWKQLGDIKQGQRNWATLQVCDKYDLDPIIRTVVSRLKNYENTRLDETVAPVDANNGYGSKDDSITLLNYFDAIAIGMEQGFYVEDIVTDHLYGIMDGWIDILMSWDELELTEANFKNWHQHLYKYVDGVRSDRNKVRAKNK